MHTAENQIVIYHPNETVRLGVRFENEMMCTSSSDIDWLKPIPDIGRKLYAKYGLTESVR